jgi:hypothetical protein
LSDAVLGDIARVEPFAVDGLEDLPPLLTHRAALGLWRLTVAATLTRAEQRILLGADGGDTAIVLREEDVAWHAPWRFEVAQHLARRLLTGAKKDENLQMLTAQEDAFRVLLFDFERTDDFDHPLLRGLTRPFNDLGGRGGAAVWRAERSLAMTDIAGWLTSPNRPSSFVVTPPGWRLRLPSGWSGIHLPYGVSVPPERRADLAERFQLPFPQVDWITDVIARYNLTPLPK